MLIDFINKLQLLFFFMSFLVAFRHGFYFLQSIITSTENEPKKYRLNKKQLFLLCLSIAYICTITLYGIK